MQLVLLNDLPKKVKHAGFKARADVINTIKKNNSVAELKVGSGLSPISRIASAFNLLMQGMVKKNGFTLIANYPLGRPRWAFLLFMKKIKKCNIIVVVHDLQSLRGNANDDYNDLKNVDVIISHNEMMTKNLRENGIERKVVNLKLFDYLLESTEIDNSVTSYSNFTVTYAGNLSKSKSGFLYSWRPNYTVNLYGINLEDNNISNNISYNGSFEPDIPDLGTTTTPPSFGLVWDGDSTHTCSGFCGEYLKINNPHKVSLYLSQGMPLIVWKHSALAGFVSENGLGYLVEDLGEIDGLLKNTTVENFGKMRLNASEFAKKVRSGYFINDAISQSLQMLNLK